MGIDAIEMWQNLHLWCDFFGLAEPAAALKVAYARKL